MSTPNTNCIVIDEAAMARELSLRAQDNLGLAEALEPFLKALGNKYHPDKNPDGCSMLGIAENDLMGTELTDHFNTHFKLTPQDLSYASGVSGSLRLRTNLARFLNGTLRPLPANTVSVDQIHVSSGVSAVVDQLTWSLCDEGEGILIGRPLYGGFITDLQQRSRAVPILVEFGNVDPFSVEGVEKYEEALQTAKRNGITTKALIICNPHNPLGKCYPIETLTRFISFAAKHNIHLISDEVYARSHHSGPQDFQSILSLPYPSPVHVHVVYGMSKDFSSNGLRLGALITRNPPLLAAIKSVALFAWAGSAGDAVWSALLGDEEFLSRYFAENSRRLRERYVQITSWCEETGVPYQKGGGYGFFLWVDLGRWCHQGEKTLMDRLVENKVFLAGGTGFGTERVGWMRITFSMGERELAMGLQRLENVLRIIEFEKHDEQFWFPSTKMPGEPIKARL